MTAIGRTFPAAPQDAGAAGAPPPAVPAPARRDVGEARSAAGVAGAQGALFGGETG